MSKSKKKVVVSTATKKTNPTVSKRKSVSTVASTKKRQALVFGKINYMLMLGGIGLIAIGLVLMSGGAMPSPEVWDESLIYSGRRTVLAPFVIILGLVLEIYAIFKNPDTGSSTNAKTIA